MAKANWSIDEAVVEHKERITQWRSAGHSREACAKKLSKLTGRRCTEYVMGKVFKKLGLVTNLHKLRRLEITDQSEEVDEISIEELIQHRVKASQHKLSKATRHKKHLELPAEPIGIFLIGDPHVDNEGCDWATLYDHVQLASKTEGVLAACVGDMQDNWIGRLAVLYAKSSVSASDGWRLSEWLLSSLQYIAIVGGNHDAWAHAAGVDPMAWLVKKCGVLCYAPDELRITLNWKGRPDLEPLIWVLRHDFKGRSWFHTTHGPHKAAILDGKCHLLTAGHLHNWGQLSSEARHGRVTHAIRVRGYKRADSFALSKEFYEQEHGESCLIVIDPFKEGPGRISVFWDLEKGCEFLTYLRSTTEDTSLD